MIKKSVFENDLIYGMQRELQAYEKKQGMNNLVKAAECLHAAVEIFEEAGMTAKADQVLKILEKIAQDSNDAHGKPHKPKNPTRVSDSHTKGLTPEKMVANLKGHGTVFNMADDGAAADNLDDLIQDITDKGGALNLAFNVPDQDNADDLLDLDINDADMEVFDNVDEDKTFEEEDS